MRHTRDKTNFFLYKLLFAVAFALVFMPFCRADELTDEILEFSGADEIENMLPDSVAESEEFSGMTLEDSGLGDAVVKIIKMLLSGLKKELKSFVSLCAFLVVCALMRLHGGLFGGSAGVINYICMLCASGYCYIFVYDTLTLVGRAITEIDTFMSAMLPIMASLCTVSGNAAAALTQNAGMYAAMTLFEKINSSLLFPMFSLLYALSMVCAVSDIDLTGLMKFIKRFIIRVCVTILTLLVSVLFFQSSFSAAADTLAMRGAKYAASLIPIVGALVGEATRTVAAGISFIKTSAGVFAAAAVLYTVCIPAVALIAKKLLLSLCVVVGRIIGAGREAEFMEEVNGILSILLSVLLSVGIFFILALTIFIKTAVNV